MEEKSSLINKEKSFSDIVTIKASKSFNVIKSGKGIYYPHPTFIVSSVSEYIGLISIISNANNRLTSGDTVVYRGMCNEDFDLRPGLARIKKLNEDTEQFLVNEFITRRPDDFAGLSDFDILAKMQHYRLPTRLLDFTTNPLVALYFACESLFEKRGRVLCNNTFLKNDSEKYVQAICNAVIKKPFDECYYVDDYLCNEQISLKQYLNNAYLFQETTVIRPKYWNQRIVNQAAVFMVFPNEIRDKYWNIIAHIDNLGIDKAIYEYGIKDINKELVDIIFKTESSKEYLNQTNSFLTDDHYKRLLSVYDRNKIVDMIDHRYVMSVEIQQVNDKKKADDFCSIIIEGKDKKKIIKELSNLGIGEDFIYPELEYTAKEIKRLVE